MAAGRCRRGTGSDTDLADVLLDESFSGSPPPSELVEVDAARRGSDAAYRLADIGTRVRFWLIGGAPVACEQDQKPVDLGGRHVFEHEPLERFTYRLGRSWRLRWGW